MRLLPILTLAFTSAAVVGCGSTHAARSYSDHDAVYRTPAYDDRYYYEDNGPPAVPVYRHGMICSEDDDCYDDWD